MHAPVPTGAGTGAGSGHARRRCRPCSAGRCSRLRRAHSRHGAGGWIGYKRRVPWFAPRVVAGIRSGSPSVASLAEHATAHLVEFHALEQRFEVAVGKAVVALALYELEEDRAEQVFAEDLQQQFAGAAVDHDLALLEGLQRLAMARDALLHQLVVSVQRVEQAHAAAAQRVYAVVEVVGAHGDVLYAFALVPVQIFLDLAGSFPALFIDRDADLAAGAGHGPALDAGELAFDVEVAQFAEVEQPLVEVGPFVHPAPVHVVRQVVDIAQAMAPGVQGFGGADAGQGLEVDVEKGDVADVAGLGAVLAAPAIDQVDQAVAQALERRDVQLARAGRARIAPGAQVQRTPVSGLGIVHAQRDGADTGAVLARKALGKAVGLGVDDEVDLALAVQRDGLVAMARDGPETQADKHPAHGLRAGGGEFDEFETVGAHGVVPAGAGGRGCWLRQCCVHGASGNPLMCASTVRPDGMSFQQSDGGWLEETGESPYIAWHARQQRHLPGASAHHGSHPRPGSLAPRADRRASATARTCGPLSALWLRGQRRAGAPLCRAARFRARRDLRHLRPPPGIDRHGPPGFFRAA